MNGLKYKVGDYVRIKSIDWYNENKDEYGYVRCTDFLFTPEHSKYCGCEFTISHITEFQIPSYVMENNGHEWTDEMIEGLVEEETKPNIIEEAKTYWDGIKDAWICPEGYIFKDENGNIINATKIVLAKKEKEYPKTFLGCCDVLGIEDLISRGVKGYKSELLDTFQKLLICRDAYWKIAGEEMGLGKPWKPSDSDYITGRYCIFVHRGNIICSTPAEDCPFTFPTDEMRDAFYENFKVEIEQCKELL